MKLFFVPNKRLKQDNNLDIKYGAVHIKQYHTVVSLGCVLDENLSENQWLCRSLRKSILDYDFCIGKIDFCVWL